MKTIKPLRLSLLNRPYVQAGRTWLGVAALGLVGLEPEPRLYSEQDLWRIASEEIGAGGVLDLGLPKLVPEWLLSGYGHTAHQADKTTCAVQVRVGGMEKSLTVFGDRYWLDGRATQPQAFDRMPLDWTRAFGGPGFPENPLGTGAEEEQVNGVRTRRLPNVEAPGQRMRSPRDAVRPSGFGAIPPDWPQRLRLLGSDYGEQWREQDFPGLARDADWRYFNAAPVDQRWEGLQEVPAGLPYELWNMHPAQPVLRGCLPDWRVRAFASWHKDGSELKEAGLRLTTVWFFPHLERAVLIWHGVFSIAEDDASDVHHLMAAIERPDEPRPMGHYASVLAKRLNPETAIHAVRDSDLAPKSILGLLALDEQLRAPERPSVRNAKAGARRQHEQRKQALLQRGLDPEVHLPPFAESETLPDLDDLPLYQERLKREFEDMRRAKGEAGGMGAGGAQQKPSAPAMDEDLLAQMPDGGARVDPGETIRRLRARRAAEAAAETRAPDDAQRQATQAAQDEAQVQRIRESHRHMAHLQPAPPQATSFRSAKWRRRLDRARDAAKQFVGANLSGVDLSDMDLRGYDFSQANLESANLSRARLDGANLSGAVLARATLAQASLINARLDGASLAKAHGTRADFTGASMDATNCQGAVFDEAVFRQARFRANELRDSQWRRCDLRESHWSNLVFWKVRLAHLRFDAAQFKQVIWVECAFDQAAFVGARLDSCGFITTDASAGVDFSDASLEACSFAHGTAMPAAVFRRARLKQCGLRTTRLEGADFTGAHLENCDFSECDLARARLDGLVAGESLFIRANLNAASLQGADLIDASLAKADLRFANLERANLYRADVSQALIDATTLLAGAYTQHAKLWPKRREEAGA
ncbi:DUF2169 family type VI secretion system accessory protein [Variovorax boronicumulans]|uniref:DUF2169 family type VI secretion system accessory protein n=1 Tax=Variovorax boronicumulans TaxID=436515 RepID=UPI0012E54061|nr:DUF2169 domain-containing protein [Variovorax boronicumulans]GER18574.1 DUF2169 domain-containing protein [Variovorax boronicumulans]